MTETVDALQSSLYKFQNNFGSVLKHIRQIKCIEMENKN